MNTHKDWTDPAKTKSRVLPYDFKLLLNRKVAIKKKNSQLQKS